MFSIEVNIGSGLSYQVKTTINTELLPEAEDRVASLLKFLLPNTNFVLVYIDDLQYEVYETSEPLAKVHINSGG